MSKYHGFKPEWEHEPPPSGSFRSILKWGDPDGHKEPNERLYRLMKETFGLDDEAFRTKRDEGLEAVPDTVPSGLAAHHVAALRDIVGEDDVRVDTYSRLSVAYGKTMWDLYRLREGVMENLPDAVVRPHDKDQIERIVAYCAEQRIALTVYGGGSSATRGLEPYRGGVTLDLRPYFNDVVSFNETNQTITVEAGISGPKLEEALNRAPQNFAAGHRYTCGHFPQSF